MRTRPLAMMLLGATFSCSSVALGQQPWIDAGQQAMIQHQGNLLEQQTAPNNDEKPAGRRSSMKQKRDAALACAMSRDREKLRPEYERRVRTDGRPAADSWLRREAAALGRLAGERAKAGYRC